MTTRDYQIQNDAFVSALLALLRDRGLAANLRKWWSATTRHYAYPVLGRLRALENDRKTIAAALFAVHATGGGSPHVSGGPSIGKAAFTLAGGSTKAAGFDSMEKHFRRLLSADDLDALAPQLHRLVKRLERAGIPLDYSRLLGDLRQFGKSPEQVKTRWAIDFWQAAEPETQDTPQP